MRIEGILQKHQIRFQMTFSIYKIDHELLKAVKANSAFEPSFKTFTQVTSLLKSIFRLLKFDQAFFEF